LSELRDAAQELLDYYDSLKAKYGRIAEFKAVGRSMERLREAVQTDASILVDVEDCPGMGEYRLMIGGKLWGTLVHTSGVAQSYCKGVGVGPGSKLRIEKD
jgi:hypothetical protein